MIPSREPHENDALASQLRSAVLHPLRPAELRTFWTHTFLLARGQAVRAGTVQFEGVAPIYLWRIVRALALIQGLVGDDELLHDGLPAYPSPWTNPYRPPQDGRDRHGTLSRGQAMSIRRQLDEGEGLPLLPPAHDAAARARWCETAVLIGEAAGMLNDPVGRAVLEVLGDVQSAHLTMVTRQEIEALEAVAVDEAAARLVNEGERGAAAYFREVYQFSRVEARALVKLGATHLQRTMGSDVEQTRAWLIASLQDFLGRAKEAMNLDHEMKALKEIGKVVGVTRSKPDDIAEAFTQVIDAAAKKADRQIEARPRQALPAPADAEYTLLEGGAEEEDPADLADFDAENRRQA